MSAVFPMAWTFIRAVRTTCRPLAASLNRGHAPAPTAPIGPEGFTSHLAMGWAIGFLVEWRRISSRVFIRSLSVEPSLSAALLIF